MIPEFRMIIKEINAREAIIRRIILNPFLYPFFPLDKVIERMFNKF